MENSEYSITANNGQTVTCETWKSGSRINFSVFVDGVKTDEGTTDDDMGRSTAETEAEFQAKLAAKAVDLKNSAREKGKRLISSGMTNAEAEAVANG